MATILKVTDTGDGQVILSVDVAVDTIAEVAVPLGVHLLGGSQAVADEMGARYAARRARPRRGTP